MLSTLSYMITRYRPLNPINYKTNDSTPQKHEQPELQQQSESQSSRSTIVLSQNIHKMILQLFGEFINEYGTAVDYAGIKKSLDFAKFQELTLQLHVVDLSVMSEIERKVFFINLYNCAMIHAVTMFGSPSNMVTRLKFFAEIGYCIGPHFYSLNDIEHGILRNNGINPVLGTPQFSPSDPRKSFAVTLDPRIHFALVCGAKSCPPIKIFSVDNLDRALDLAARGFCSNHVTVQLPTTATVGGGGGRGGSEYNSSKGGSNKGSVTVSLIFKWYASDFGKSPENILKYVAKYRDDVAVVENINILLRDGFVLKYEEYDWRVNGNL